MTVQTIVFLLAAYVVWRIAFPNRRIRRIYDQLGKEGYFIAIDHRVNEGSYIEEGNDRWLAFELARKPALSIHFPSAPRWRKNFAESEIPRIVKQLAEIRRQAAEGVQVAPYPLREGAPLTESEKQLVKQRVEKWYADRYGQDAPVSFDQKMISVQELSLKYAANYKRRSRWFGLSSLWRIWRGK